MIRLTSYTDCSLRTLVYLGVSPDRLTPVSEVAEAYGLSTNHLMKVANHLAAGGYVEAVRGDRGGIRLARTPAEITAVVRHTETDMLGCHEAGINAQFGGTTRESGR